MSTSGPTWRAGRFWVFQGNPDCNRCSEMTGYYGSWAKPARPHNNCRCPLYPVYTAGLFDEECTVSENMGGGHTIHGTPRSVTNNLEHSLKRTIHISETISVGASASLSIADSFGVSGNYSTSITISESIEVEVPPHSTVSATPVVNVDTIVLRRECTLSKPGTDIEIQMPPEEEQISGISGYTIEVS